MPNLKDLKNRIASVKSTRKITKAMQMVAAAKLRRAQDAAEMARPYTERFSAVMGALAASVGDSASAPRLLAGTGEDKVHLLVVMTSERGLCGGFCLCHRVNRAGRCDTAQADLGGYCDLYRRIGVHHCGGAAAQRHRRQHSVLAGGRHWRGAV